MKKEIPNLRTRVSDAAAYEKSLAETEDKFAKELLNYIEIPMQHQQLAIIYRSFSEFKTALSTKRFQLQAILEEVKEEWKQLEARDIHDIKQKQDLANRALSDSVYWTNKNHMAQAKEKETQYRMYCAELLQLIHELRMRKENLIPQYLLRIAQAEAQFYREASQCSDFIEKQIKDLGPITPVPFNGVPGYTVTSQQNQSFTVTQNQPTQNQPTIVQVNYQTPPSTGPRARALYQFDAENSNELSFRPNDILNIITQQGDWWTAELNGRQGIVPSNYVQLI